MTSENIVTERHECLVWAFSALDLRFVADPFDPLIPTYGRIARLSILRILPSAREHILSSAKEASEQRNFLGRLRGLRHTCGDWGWLFGHLIGPRAFQRAQPVGDLQPFPVERGQIAPLQGRNLLSDVVRAGDDVVSFSR
jgi:hypothetical protein